MQQGHEAEDETRGDGDRQREREHGPVEPDLRRPWNRLGIDGQQEAQASDRESDADDGRGNRQHHALGHKLPH
ncbi:hypothetical protein D3C83_131130 [compost metagenome]